MCQAGSSLPIESPTIYITGSVNEKRENIFLELSVYIYHIITTCTCISIHFKWYLACICNANLPISVCKYICFVCHSLLIAQFSAYILIKRGDKHQYSTSLTCYYMQSNSTRPTLFNEIIPNTSPPRQSSQVHVR